MSKINIQYPDPASRAVVGRFSALKRHKEVWPLVAVVSFAVCGGTYAMLHKYWTDPDLRRYTTRHDPHRPSPALNQHRMMYPTGERTNISTTPRAMHTMPSRSASTVASGTGQRRIPASIDTPLFDSEIATGNEMALGGDGLQSVKEGFRSLTNEHVPIGRAVESDKDVHVLG